VLTKRVCLFAPLLFSALCFASCSAIAAPEVGGTQSQGKVTLIHSEGSYGGFVAAQEFDRDFTALGLTAAKVPVSKLATTSLGGNELVIVGSMLLRNPRREKYWENPDDLKLDQHGRKLWEYVNAGGTLFITDVLEDRGIYDLSHISSKSRLKVSECEYGTVEAFRDAPLFSTPHKLANYQPNYDPFQICRRVDGKFAWGHFTSVKRGWQTLATCPDGAPVVLSRTIGKGTLVVTTLSAGRAIDAGWLENLLASAHTHSSQVSGATPQPAAAKLKSDYFRLKGTAPRGKLPFDKQGNILSDGKPFFPLGFYAVAPENYPLLAANGFNSSYDVEPEAAAAAGIKGMAMTSWDLDIARDQTVKHKTDSTILGQQLFEEPGNLPVPPFVSNYFRRADDIVKEVAPNRPTFVLVNNPLEFPAFGTIGDMGFCDPYTFEKPNSPATRPGVDIDRLRKMANNPNHPVMAILQAHWFGEKDKTTYLEKPTPAQMLAQTYVALVHRVNGIYYFAFDKVSPNESISYIHQPDGSFDEPLWTALKQVATEIEVLRPALLAELPPQQARAVSPRNEVQSLLRQDGSKRYLLVVNPYAKPIEARLEFDRAIKPKSIRTLFGDQEIQVGRKGAKVMLAPYQREVYVFDSAPTSKP
jgi:hypothetical protein